ncbi:TetR/AcrR family transcriptional regulator [Kibdelosporangium aridum]|uniref:TetR/AcrR family transcriptional regulator n=1 Tax=Kibdelosporangium aridum TaxID=2030 RepID=UPI0006924761
MSGGGPSRRVRADAERSTARILEAAEDVLAADPTAPLERIADAAGVARATVHRRFSSRTALLDALAAQLNERYVRALAETRVTTAPPLVALQRLTETVFNLKLSHRFAVQLDAAVTPEVLAGLDLLFARLRDAGVITALDPVWCRRVYLALLHEAHDLPADSPVLTALSAGSEVEARINLLVDTVIGALGGTGTTNGLVVRSVRTSASDDRT